MAATRSVYPGVMFQLPDGGMTEEQFYRFCLINPELRIERGPDKKIIVMPPTNSETGNLNFDLAVEIGIWNKRTGLGKGFDSSTGFKLPNGAERSPDVAWITNERWDAVPPELRRRFAPITPDFVLELRSPDQNLAFLQEKMEEYRANGCRLAWLVDPQNRTTFVFRADGSITTVPFEQTLRGEGIMPGFELRIADL